MLCERDSEFSLPTRVIYGYNSAKNTGKCAEQMAATSVLVVTDSNIYKAGVLKSTIQSLKEANRTVTVFDSVPIDPGTKTVEAGVEVLEAHSCEAVVIVGGGSPLCAGKGIALVATNGGNIEDYEGTDRYKEAPLPVIAVPTTAGSGSEVSSAFNITNETKQYRMSIRGRRCYPEVAILDPVLLKTLPSRQMIESGMDALTHAIEAICTDRATPLTDAIAYEALKRMVQHLPRAAFSHELEAIGQQLLGSTMANIACGNAKLGLVHAMSPSLAVYNMSHGLANGILLPYVMEYNLPAGERRFARMASVLGVYEPSLSDADNAVNALDSIKDLLRKLEVPDRVSVDDSERVDVQEMVEAAMEKSQIEFNIRRPSYNDIREIYEKAYDGWR